MNAYQQEIEAVEKHFNTNIKTGLSSNQAKELYQSHKKYKLKVNEPSIIFIFASQFKDPLIYILLIAATIIFFLGEPLDAFIISGILLFNAFIGTVQEKRTSSILKSLHSFIITETIVVRDGIEQIVSNDQLVPGDIIIIKPGEQIPADARIVESDNAQVDEAIFTGESHPVRKSTQVIVQDAVPPYEQNNMIFQGTHLLSGTIKAIITATGKQSATGEIFETISTIETNIPLKKEVEKISWSILIGTLILCASLLIIGLLTGKSFVDLLVMLTALFICIIPEGLPLVMTLIMISGAHRMAKKNVLVTHLQSIEALGRVDTIIIDKTGTLTKNELMVQKLFVNEKVLQVTGKGYHLSGEVENISKHKESVAKLASAVHLLQNAHVEFDEDKNAKIKGDPTEAALQIFSLKAQHNPANQSYKKIASIPFSSDYKYQSKLYQHEGEAASLTMGAPEKIFEMCGSVSEETQAVFQNFSSKGYRVIAVAEKKQPQNLESLSHSDLLGNAQFIGMLAIQDTIREDIKPVIEQAKADGIKIIMATGDHEKTAQYIAEKVGIYNETNAVMTSSDFEKLDDQTATQQLRKTSVCARFSPQDKLRLIKLYHKQHKIVAMTGDGINDVPALVAADISITMGGTAADVTKQASDIILLEDSFKNIIYAIQEGKSMFLALKRTILYFLTSNSGEVLIVFFSLILNLPMPMLAAQILWLNLITDGFLDVALSMEPAHPQRKQKREPLPQKLIDKSVFYKTIYLSLPMSLISLGVFLHYYQTDIVLARTLTLLIMAMFQWFNAWNCRSEKESIFTIGLFSNKWLILATVTVLALQVGVIYLPFMQTIFRTTNLELHHWGLAIGLSSLILVAEETKKFVVRRFF
jgi:P-type Ca2+ transporter type 2C